MTLSTLVTDEDCRAWLTALVTLNGRRPISLDPAASSCFPATATLKGRPTSVVGRGFSLATYRSAAATSRATGAATFDFASDDKRQKHNARLMLKMTADVNARLADVPEPRPAGTPAVTCYTCHRGETKPQTMRPQPPGL